MVYLPWFPTVFAWAALLAFLVNGLRPSPTTRRLAKVSLWLFLVAEWALVLLLLVKLVGADYSLEYVRKQVANDLTLFYRVAALWSGQAGSLLLWAALTGVAALVLAREENPWAGFIGALPAALFSGLVLFSNPFAPAKVLVSDGMGMNPLLRNVWMLLHPPAIYLGFVFSVLPFAYTFAYALDGSKAYLQKARAWGLVSLFFLGLGIFLGGRWAYVELGWGGYWYWDPVENASFIPWLFGAAFVHAAVVASLGRGFKRWLYFSSFLFFLNTVIGAFITRSGVISSVHAFGYSKIAYAFYAFFVVLAIFFFATLPKVLRGLERGSSPLASREGFLNLANAVVYLIAFWVLFATLFWPVLFGKNMSPETYNSTTAPAFIAWLLLLGLAILAPWTGGKWKPRRLLGSLGAALGLVPAWFFLGIKHPYGLLGSFVAGFVIVSALWGLWAYRRTLVTVGAHLTHLGLGIAAIGIIGSHGEITLEAPWEEGKTVQVAGISMRMSGMRVYKLAGKHLVHEAQIETPYGVLRPHLTRFAKWERMGSFSEADIIPRPLGDVYAALYELKEGGINLYAAWVPLIQWLWVGCTVLVFGGIIPLFRRR